MPEPDGSGIARLLLAGLLTLAAAAVAARESVPDQTTPGDQPTGVAGPPPAPRGTGAPAPARTPPRVARAAITSAVVDREPVDNLLTLSNEFDRVYFFTDLRHLEGHRVSHRWYYRDRLMSEVQFEIRGPRWRVWSSKSLDPSWVGEWRVAVVDQDGTILATRQFVYTSAVP